MNEKVDLSFALKGAVIPADHGYMLFSALTRVFENIHSIYNTGIHNISGEPIANRLLKLSAKSRLTFRLDSEIINLLLPLAGKYLNLGGHEIMIGTPQTYLLKPVPRLYSRLVVIKGYMEPDEFLEAAEAQLSSMSIKGRPSLITLSGTDNNTSGKGTRSAFLRRTIRISGKEVVGFALGVNGLNAEESITLQENGIGGRRHFGCGLFIPDRR
ncbi:MAG: type I-MYXAN CRISPR-associated protein Cas6/Cmx6 [Bacillota bacterium]|nr:type I-MYXAN CRISPR-associated protein Cas6/Cmx6 [Bacillota bacterium]